MNIKDAYIHGTHGVVKNINVAIKESEPYDDSILYYTLADLSNTSHYVKLPLASATQNGLMSSLDKIKLNNLSTDAKHTAGSTNSDSKLFLIGATSQSANPQTYSHDTAYVGNDGFLYSNSKKVDMDLVVPLNAQGSTIPPNADLNTIEYLKTGNYYCKYTDDAVTIKNCPVTRAFRMEVYSILERTPNESYAWSNRLRKLTTTNGKQYIQHCFTEATAGEFTYGDWIYIPTVKAVMDLDANGSITKVGDSATPVYINTNGNFEACTNVQSDISKAVDASTRITTSDDLDKFIEAGKVKFAILGKEANLPKPILSGNDGLIVSHGWATDNKYGYQMAYDDNGYNISFRYCNNGTWSAWKTLTFEDHTHKYAGSDSAGGPANEVKISPGSTNVERNIVVSVYNSLFSVPKVTGNYAEGTLTANYFKFNEFKIKHPDNSNFWQAIFGETLPTGLTTVKPFRFDRNSESDVNTVSYNNNTVQLYNNYAASLIWTTYDTFGYLNIPAYPHESDNVWIGGGNNTNANGWSAKLFHSRKNLIPQEKDKYDVGSSEYKWKDVHASTFIGNLDGYYVNKLTGYTETKSDAKITAADTLNAALSKLEHKADLAYKWVSSVTAETDTDEYVNKWDEIVDFLDSVKEGSDISTSFVTTATEQIITGLKTFQTESTKDNLQSVALKLKNTGWFPNMSTAVDFYNGKAYTVPNARIETKMNNSGNQGGTLIFSTQEISESNPNPNGLTERFRLSDDGVATFNTVVSPKTHNTYNLGTDSLRWRNVYATTFTGNLNGNANTSTKTGISTIWLYPERQNEINFGGTNQSTTIYFGAYKKDERPIPQCFVFGGGTGTAELVAKTFTGALQGNASSASMLAETPIKTNAKYWVSTSSWTNTGYTFESLDAGTYAIQLTSDNLIASGIMSVLKNVVDTMGDEIPLHVYGTAGWRPYLRTRENKLQIASNDVSNTERTVTIKIARIL